MPLLRQHLWKLLFFALALLFLLLPAIDLWVVGWFYRPEAGFYMKQLPLTDAVFQAVQEMAPVLLYGLGGGFVLSSTVLRRQLGAHRARIGYLLVVLLLGPGLLVNVVLKNQIGRARPDKIVEFGGTKEFSPAFYPADECASNCAFVSGHAALGFYPLSVGYVLPRRRLAWLIGGLLSGSFVGSLRIIQGRHFLSDVVFAFFAVFVVATLTYHLFRRFGWLPAMPTDAGKLTDGGVSSHQLIPHTNKTDHGQDLRPFTD